MSKWSIKWECTYKKMPQNVEEFLTQLLGKNEMAKLIRTMQKHEWVMMIGPECSGKTTVVHILRALGYPFVIDENGLGNVIRTSHTLTDLKTNHAILEELGIEAKH